MKKKYIISEKQLQNLYDRFEKNEAINYPVGADMDPNAPWNAPIPTQRYSEHENIVGIGYDKDQYLYKDEDGNYIYYFDSDYTLKKELYAGKYLPNYNEPYSKDMDGRYTYHDVFNALNEYLNDYVAVHPNKIKSTLLDDFYYGKVDYIYITPETQQDIIDELVESEALKKLIKFN